MKHFLSIIIVVVFMFSLCSCGNRKAAVNNFDLREEIGGFSVETDLPHVGIETADYDEFLKFMDYDGIDCPYVELFGIEEAMAEKDGRNFEVSEHTYDFFEGADSVDSERLYEVVKANNEKYMEGADKYFYEKPSDSQLKECCVIVADTINWGIENTDGIDMDALGCILGNLKILNRDSMNYASFDCKKDILNISPGMIKEKKNRSGIADIYEITITHEAMHILQFRCTDVEQGAEDVFIGTSYSFENLDVNSLKISWLYEASAELNTTLRFGCEPTTYQYMVDNLESIGLATVLNDDVKARQLEKLCFAHDEDALYNQLEFTDKTKAAEFLFAVELLRKKNEDFKTAYENKYGAFEEDYSGFLTKTYTPYFVEVVSKLFYKNLSSKLAQSEMSLNDVFYIISLYELDLLKDIPFDNPTVREQYNTVYEQYSDLRKEFLGYIQKYTDTDVLNAFKEYRMNYENGSGVYANASLDWLEDEKRDYILFRNNSMYDKKYCFGNSVF